MCLRGGSYGGKKNDVIGIVRHENSGSRSGGCRKGVCGGSCESGGNELLKSGEGASQVGGRGGGRRTRIVTRRDRNGNMGGAAKHNVVGKEAETVGATVDNGSADDGS